MLAVGCKPLRMSFFPAAAQRETHSRLKGIRMTPTHGRFLCYYKNAYSNGVMSPVNEQKPTTTKTSARSALRDFCWFFYWFVLGFLSILASMLSTGEGRDWGIVANTSHSLPQFGCWFVLGWVFAGFGGFFFPFRKVLFQHFSPAALHQKG